MTPKEKALHLCQQFGYTTLNEEFNEGYTLPLEIAKKCALICVDEILATNLIFDEKYYQEVKEEIKNL